MKERKKDRQTETETETETGRQTETETETGRQTDRQTDTDRHRERPHTDAQHPRQMCQRARAYKIDSLLLAFTLFTRDSPTAHAALTQSPTHPPISKQPSVLSPAPPL